MPQCYWDITLSAKLGKISSDTTFSNFFGQSGFYWQILCSLKLLLKLESVCICWQITFTVIKLLSLTPSSDQGQSPAGKMVYPGGPGTKITSVSTGNLCADVSNCRSKASGVLMLNAPADQLTLECQEQSLTHSI